MDWRAQPLLENIRERSGSPASLSRDRRAQTFTNAQDDRILFAT